MDAVVSNDGGGANAQTLTSSGWDFRCDFEVDYGSNEHASIVYAALGVDKELQPDKVKRQISVSDGKLAVGAISIQSRRVVFLQGHFEAVEARFLRASFSAFVDLMILATKIIEEYGTGSGNPEER